LSPVRGEDLANKIGVPCLRLVVLNACKSARVARSPGYDGPLAFTGIATSLVVGGLPAVIAMRAAISDEAAIAFSQAFYRRLALGEPVDSAMVEGRQAIHSKSGSRERAEWSMPVLFMRTKEGELFPSEDLPGEKYPKRPWWPGWVAAGILLLLLGGGAWRLSVDRSVRDGSRFLQQNQPEEARNRFLRALLLAPRSADAHLGIAMAEQALGQNRAAEENYSKAVELKPHDSRYRYHWGAFLNLRERYEEAARELEQAIVNDRTYVQAYNELARTQIAQGFWGEARKTLHQSFKYARDNDPNLSIAPLYDKLGQVDLHDNRLDEAVDHLTAALDRYPRGDFRRLQTLLTLAQTYARKEDRKKVCATIGEVRAIDPQGFMTEAVAIRTLASRNHCPWPEEL